MKTFLAIPPVNDSLGPLKPAQWGWLAVSFSVSLALFALCFLTATNHFLFLFVLCALSLTTLPMKVYAMNRKGRLVGRLYYAIVLGSLIYLGWNRIEAQFSKSPFTLLMLIALCAWAYWFTLETAKVNEQFLKQLGALQEQINSIESTVEHLKRNI